jgi:hypothetical protein
MTGDEVRQVFEAMLPQDEIERVCQQGRVLERQRTLHLGMVVRAMVLSAGTPGGAYQADVWRASLEFAVPPVTRAAFYRWFDAPLEQCMATRARLPVNRAVMHVGHKSLLEMGQQGALGRIW